MQCLRLPDGRELKQPRKGHLLVLGPVQISERDLFLTDQSERFKRHGVKEITYLGYDSDTHNVIGWDYSEPDADGRITATPQTVEKTPEEVAIIEEKKKYYNAKALIAGAVEDTAKVLIALAQNLLAKGVHAAGDYNPEQIEAWSGLKAALDEIEALRDRVDPPEEIHN